jgi:hypothetical protein
MASKDAIGKKSKDDILFLSLEPPGSFYNAEEIESALKNAGFPVLNQTTITIITGCRFSNGDQKV